MATQAWTANIENVSRLANRALLNPNGITLRFTVATHGSLAACHARARSTQNTFTSLRARARHLTKASKESAHHTQKGPYDVLVCRREPLPNDEGWAVHFLHAEDMFIGVDIVDGLTGEPLETVQEEERLRLITRLTQDWARFTPEDYDRLKELDPSVFADGWELEREDCDGKGLHRHAVARRAAIIRSEEAASAIKPTFDPNQRHVDLAEVLTPGNLWEDDGDTET